MLREKKLHTVCEEATCPNIGECFGRGTATFMILGDICTRRCPFCDVGHGQPLPPNPDEPRELAESVAALKLKYVVITSVDRDDLRDGGAQHFVDVIRNVRELSPATTIETLVPDFRGRMEIALDVLGQAPCPTCSTTTWKPCPASTSRRAPAPTTGIRWNSSSSSRRATRRFQASPA
jgi:lipoic acid synthetase